MEAAATTNPRETGRKETTMVSTFSTFCPCGCGSTTTATDAGFSATTVTVACCDASLLASVTMPKSAAYAAAVPATTVSHRAGLVHFGV